MPTITGTNGDDILTGTSGDDNIQGLGGNDTITDNFDYGDDTIDGGEGNDTILVSRFGETVPVNPLTVHGGAGDDFIRIAPTYGRTVNITGGSGGDRIELNNGATFTIDAGADDDVITITATHGSRATLASITLGGGVDSLFLSYATYGDSVPKMEIVFNDFTPGDAGDRVDFGDYFAANGDAVMTLTQQGAHAVLSFNNGGSITYLNTDMNALTWVNMGGFTTGGFVNLMLNGTAGPDTLAGQLGDDVVNGGAGNDILTGGGGDDQINGEGGDDDLYGGPGANVLHGGDDNDILRDLFGFNQLYGDDGNDIFYYTRSLNGPTPGTNFMFGGGGNDSFFVEVPFGGDTQIEGGAGDDLVRSGAAGGSVDLGADNDTIILGPPAGKALAITMGSGVDTLAFEKGGPAVIQTNGIHVTDFQAGDGGDIVDAFSAIALTWDYATNPFHYAGSPSIVTIGMVKLDGVTGSMLTAHNLGGFATDGTPFAGQNFTGDGNPNPITGSRGGDTIDGLGGADTLRGGWGHDTLNGGDQNDDLDGEGGSDIVNGGAGDDNIHDTIQGSDTLNGGDGNDVITLSRDLEVTRTATNLTIDGGNDNDVINVDIVYHGLGQRPAISGTIAGGAGNDVIDVEYMEQATITGGTGNDVIRVYHFARPEGSSGLTPAGIIDAGDGDDVVELLSTTNDVHADVTLGAGRDVIALARGPLGTVGLGNAVLDFQAGAGGDRLEIIGPSPVHFVQNGPHTLVKDEVGVTILTLKFVTATNLVPENLSYRLSGTAGNDVIQGTAGTDRMEGGAGDDVYYVNDAVDSVVEQPNQGNDAVYAYVSYALTAGSSVETLSTISHAATDAINLTGNGLEQTIIGNAGANVLHGGGGTDLLIGLGGNDTYYVDVAATQIQENAGGGTDTVYTSVSYALGGAEVETLSTNDYASTAAINLTGNAHSNTLIGNAGVNILQGGGGGDLLIGLGGNDLYYIDDAATQVIEYEVGGSDTVYVSSSYALGGSAEVETLSANDYGATTAINLTGNVYSQVLIGNAGANILHGGGGVDTLIGLGGNDVYYIDVAGTQAYEAAGAGADTIYTSVSYTLAAGSEVETLSSNDYGATTALSLTGNGSAQTIIGNAGANSLNGGAGADTLYGLGGADTFQFTTALGGGNVDALADFNVADDMIALDDAVFAALGAPGALNANAFATGAAASEADDRIIYNSASGQLFYDADGNGGGAAVQFASLATGLTLTASDFQVI